MGATAKITELHKIDTVLAPIDITTPRTGVWKPAAMYRRFAAVLVTDTVATTKVATLQLYQAQDVNGTGAKALGDPVSVAASGSQKLTLQVERMQAEMDEGFTHVTARATSDNSTAVSAVAILIRGEGRYGVSQP